MPMLREDNKFPYYRCKHCTAYYFCTNVPPRNFAFYDMRLTEALECTVILECAHYAAHFVPTAEAQQNPFFVCVYHIRLK